MFQSRKKDQQRRRSSNHSVAPRIQQYYSNPQNYNSLYAIVPNNNNNTTSSSNNHCGNSNSTNASTVTSVSTPPPSSAPAQITNLQKQSDPASPATIATTISSQHSTPSPSPARVAIMSDASTVSADGFALFDDASYMAPDMSSKGVSSHHQDGYSDGHTSPNHYSPANISIVVPPYPGMYGNYSSQHTPQQTQAPQQQSMVATQFPQYAAPVFQSQDELPELSPTPRKARFPSNARLSVSSVDTYNRQPATPVQTPDHNTDSSSASEAPLIYVDEWLDQYLQLNPDIHPNPMPKLGPTYSDAVQDELYNPDLIAGDYSNVGAPAPAGAVNGMSQYPEMYQTQHQQHHASPSATSPHGRDNSPFRSTSPYDATMNFVGLNGYGAAMGQQQQQQPHPRHRRESELSMVSTGRPQQALNNPKTISPKDALLEYNSPEGDISQMNFFGPCSMPSDSSRNTSRENSDLGEVGRSMSVSSRRESSFSDSLSNYTNGAGAASYMQGYSTPQSSRRYSDYSATAPVIEKPLHTRANTGAYTCTYTGCGQRFNTSGKLQKHRREAHRKSTPTANSVSTAAAIASRNAQPGPHRCMRPNPSTGKPCNTVFSRPYDLTRHEDTIHNSHKEKVRCEICTDEKTFSRPDALVRHRRVKHGIH